MSQLKNILEMNDSIKGSKNYDVKVLQFGEGNFLRAFVDWMIHKSNQSDLFRGRIRVIQPIEQGLIPQLNEQKGLYTLITRGLTKGKVVSHSEIISSIEKGIDPYSDYDLFIESADLPELRFIISNTTEAGISYRPGESLNDRPQISYPGKLTALLYRRFKTYEGAAEKGLVIIPCELIDRNGDKLKEIVLRLALEWKLGVAFTNWLADRCDFLNSLVDRIVTGYPGEEAETLQKELGYSDKLMDTAEVFHLWVIEGDKKYSKELPFKESGCNVIWTADMTPYRTRKVRILNGIHTMTCLPAYLYGLETVGDCLKDPHMNRYISMGVYGEIIPSVDFDKEQLKDFAETVMERFANPYIEHKLINITLNSVSKFKTRVLPTILEYLEIKGRAPNILTFAFASLIYFYRGKNEKGETHKVSDNGDVLEKFSSLWSDFEKGSINSERFVTEILSNIDFWGQDLQEITALREKVLFHFIDIGKKGIKKALEELL